MCLLKHILDYVQGSTLKKFFFKILDESRFLVCSLGHYQEMQMES